jgi:small-conductance mechanosensitive channel
VLFLALTILWRLTDLIALWIGARMKQQGNWETNKSLITLSVWAMRLIILIFALALIFRHVAIPITSIAITVGLIGVALSLAGRDIFADIISGILILIDRPFRLGDRIELLSLNTTGNIYEIGLRYTKVLTTDNRMVIVPNSVISRDEIVNYSYPDPSYNDATNILSPMRTMSPRSGT